MRNKEFVDCIW